MLIEALTDLKAEILAGSTLESVVADVAQHHGVNPVLLTRKFTESYGSVEAVRRTAAATDPATNLQARIERAVAEAASIYGVDPKFARVHTIHGTRYTVVCRVRGATKRPLVGVSHENALRYRLSA